MDPNRPVWVEMLLGVTLVYRPCCFGPSFSAGEDPLVARGFDAIEKRAELSFRLRPSQTRKDQVKFGRHVQSART